MDKKRRFSRLGTKLVGVSVLGLVMAFATFYLVDSVAAPWLFYSERFAPFWEKRTETAAQAYQDYVTENCLTIRQVLDHQEEGASDVASGFYSTVVSTVSSAPPASAEVDADVRYGLTWSDRGAQSDKWEFTFVAQMYPVQCADGVLYLSAAPAALRYEGLCRIAGLLLALAGFCAVVVPYIVRVLRRLGTLSRETGALMAGDLDHVICVKGRDEISGLGEDIERLRRSVLARLEGEREAVGANSRLITSLSHDIRTPLTKLTGYLDILSYGKYRSQAERDEFLRLASEKAAQLKALTDQLFASAQVAAPTSGLERPPETVDGAALLGQLLTEQGGDLRREGFDVEPPVFRRSFALYLRTEDAVRVFDNLFSNLRKYADPAFPIRMGAEDRADSVVLRIENRALPAPDRADSHGLGVPTMRELMERFGGALEASLEDGIYKSILTFPKHRESR